MTEENHGGCTILKPIWRRLPKHTTLQDVSMTSQEQVDAKRVLDTSPEKQRQHGARKQMIEKQ